MQGITPEQKLIKTNTGNCFIFGAGEFDGLTAVPGDGDLIIAADAGLRYLKELNITPDVLLGDFDSLGYIPDGKEIIRYPSVKDDPDMALAVEWAEKRGYSRFFLYGGTGGRIDHTIGNLQLLAYIARRGMEGYLFGWGSGLTAIHNSAITFGKDFTGMISVFCIGKDACGVTEKGLKYELENGTLTTDKSLGLSNEFTGKESCISVKDGTLLITWQLRTPALPLRK